MGGLFILNLRRSFTFFTQLFFPFLALWSEQYLPPSPPNLPKGGVRRKLSILSESRRLESFFWSFRMRIVLSSKVKQRCDWTAWETTSVLTILNRNRMGGTSMDIYIYITKYSITIYVQLYTFANIMLFFLRRKSKHQWRIGQKRTSIHWFDLPTVLSQLPAAGPQHSISWILWCFQLMDLRVFYQGHLTPQKKGNCLIAQNSLLVKWVLDVIFFICH